MQTREASYFQYYLTLVNKVGATSIDERVTLFGEKEVMLIQTPDQKEPVTNIV